MEGQFDASWSRMNSPTPPNRSAAWRPLALRAWRLLLLAAAVWVLQGRRQDAGVQEFGVERVRDFFPNATTLESRDGNTMQNVVDDSGITLGFVTQTAPESDDIIGYSGSTNTLIVLDAKGVVIGLRVLSSVDTSDHLAEVVRERGFFKQFTEKKAAQLAELQPHAVSGATLTSSAIAEGVLRRMGKSAMNSLRFPEAITLAEVQKLEAKADELRSSKIIEGGFDVIDAAGARIAVVTRTAPAADGVVGYKGPTDSLLLLDAKGETLKALALRKSYDTEMYVGYVTGDPAFLQMFNGMQRQDIGQMDFDEAGAEGISGATQTSWGIAEGVRVRAASMRSAAGHTLIRWRWQDVGHFGVLISAFVMAFTSLRGIAWCRHMHHALLVIYAGFVSGEMLSQGLLVGWASSAMPWRSAAGLVAMAAVALLGPVFTGKQLYCHHICPHGALQQLLAKRLRWQWSPSRRLDRVLSAAPFVLLAFVFFAAVFGLSVDLNALEPFDAYLFRIAGVASLVIAGLGLLASLFTPLAYCRYGCPTGALFKMLRFTGTADHFGVRDWIALLAISASMLLN